MSFHALPKQVHQQTVIRFRRLLSSSAFLTNMIPQQTLAPVVRFCLQFRRRLVKQISCHVLPRKALQQIMIQEGPLCFSNPHWLIYDRETTNKVHPTRENSGDHTCLVNHPGI
jgi:hypothetical protein